MEKQKKSFGLIKQYSSAAILLLEIIICSALSPYFLTQDNIINILRQISIVTIMAFGETLVIIAGQIDLSVGAIGGMAGTFACAVFLATHNLFAAVMAAILIGCAVGIVNGLVTTIFDAPPFIVTLAMQQIAFGIIYLYTNGQNIYQIGDFSKIGQGIVAGIPIPVLFMIVIFFISWFLLGYTKLGRYLYAIGGNSKAAEASGVNIRKNKISAFVLSGAFAGLGGALIMSRINSGVPSVANGMETDALMAAIIGGTSFNGGVGTAFGTLVGAVIIGILSNILNLMGVQSYVQQVLKGVLIIIAVAIDIKARNGSGKVKILKQ